MKEEKRPKRRNRLKNKESGIDKPCRKRGAIKDREKHHRGIESETDATLKTASGHCDFDNRQSGRGGE